MSFDQIDRAYCAGSPTLPPGATLHSLVTFLHRCQGSRSTERSCIQYYGRASESIEPGNPFGQGAQHLAEAVYGGEPSGLELIRRHTLLGLFGPAMGEAWWGNRFRAPIADGIATRKFAPERWLGKPLSWCPDCSREDIDQFGWAPWRVVHQVPFAHHCPSHGTALLAMCAVCNEPLDRGFHWRLPGDACRKCRGQSFSSGFKVERSLGYRRLLQVLGELDDVMATKDVGLASTTCAGAGVISSGLSHWQTVSTQLSAEWRVAHPEMSIPQLLGTRENMLFMRTALLRPDLASALAVLLLTSIGSDSSG